MKIFFLSLFLSSAFAQMSPGMTKNYEEVKKLLKALPNSKNPVKDLNVFIGKHGFPIEVFIEDKDLPKFPDALATDSPSGSRILFLKLLVEKGYKLDRVYEIADPKATKILREWFIPSNGTPSGISNDAILFATSLSHPFAKYSRPVTLSISPEGKFQVVPELTFKDQKFIQECTAVKNLFKGSSSAGCTELEDVKTKKKRTLVYLQPMT